MELVTSQCKLTWGAGGSDSSTAIDSIYNSSNHLLQKTRHVLRVVYADMAY